MKKKICGVYCIKNKINGKYYIGSSIDVNVRWKKHKQQLKNNTHPNEHLQNAWNKYGENNFSFFVLLEVDEDDLLDYEQYYIDKFNALDNSVGYNIAPETYGSSIGIGTREKISKSLIGKYYGEKCFFNKYSESLIINIINDLIDNRLSYEEISKKYDVPKSLISSIKSGKSWSYLTKNIDLNNRVALRNTKIKEENIKDIINMLLNGYSNGEISKKYNVANKTISDIRTHKTWKKYTEGINFPYVDGLIRGEQNNMSKLSLDEVKQIKQLISEKVTCKKISEIYNVSQSAIYNIKKGKAYAYIN